jgi:sugar phosphate isomerase/epimerase
MIRLGCCSFVLGKPLEDGLRLVHDLGFRYVDVSASRVGADAQIDQEQAVLDPDGCAATTRTLLTRYELEPEELFNTRMFVGGARVETNDPDRALRTQALLRFERLCAYAVQAGFKSIMAVPGMPQAALGVQGAWDVAGEMLQAMLGIARAQGIRFNVEPHTGSILETPAAAVAMALAVPGLTYTLDYSHFVSLGIAQDLVAPLQAYAAHMHARQARPGQIYATLADGVIDFPSIISELQEVKWQGVIALEYLASNTTGVRDNAVVQNALLACQLEELLGAPGSGAAA